MLDKAKRKIRKGIKKIMGETVQICKEVLSTSENRFKETVKVCKDVLSTAENRRIAGVIILSMGAGLIASSYI